MDLFLRKFMYLKTFIMLLLIGLLPLIVYAAEGKTLELDFNLNNRYDLFLKKSDRILFEYGGYNNTIIVDEIKNNTTELDIFLFLEKGLHNPDYQFLGMGYDLRLDFDKDGKKEMSMKLVKNDIKNGTTNIIFKKLDAWDENATLDLSDWKTSNENTDDTNNAVSLYFSLGVALALLLLISLVFWYYTTKRKGTYF